MQEKFIPTIKYFNEIAVVADKMVGPSVVTKSLLFATVSYAYINNKSLLQLELMIAQYSVVLF